MPNEPLVEPLDDDLSKFESCMLASERELEKVAKQRILSMLFFIKKLDKLLLWIDHLLCYSQPPTTGRIRIVWLRDDSTSALYRPKLVSWIRVNGAGGSERWRYRILSRPLKAIRAKGGFSKHREEVKELVALAQEVMKHRATITGYIGDLGRGWTQKEQYLYGRQNDYFLVLVDVIESINNKGVVHIDRRSVLR